MSYEDALKAAGAVVHAFEEFGSYQGDWYALVSFKGRTAFVHGAYGSCSLCDAFQAEFYGYGETTPEKLAAFGLSYLDEDLLLSPEEALEHASRDLEWDMEAQYMVDWIKEQTAIALAKEEG